MSSIKITHEDLVRVSKISSLLNINPEFRLWSGEITQVNWKKDNTSYMWREDTDTVEIAVNSNWEDMKYYSSEELINKLESQRL